MTKDKSELMADFAEWSIDVDLPDGTQIYLELDYASKPYPLTGDTHTRLKNIVSLTNDIEPSFLAKILRDDTPD